MGAVVCSLLAVPGADAQRPTREDQLRPTQLLSRGPNGEAPNAVVSEPVLSQDERVSRYAAYVTAATNIVAGSGAARNVYLVRRRQPWGQNGTEWNYGSTELLSKGIGGPANGDSWGPAMSGSDFINPKCMAFVSAASNLVSGDTNGRADVFYKRLPTGRLSRIAGRGPVTEVAVDGVCQHVAFVAGGSLYLKPNRGSAKKISRAGASNPHMAADGRLVTFERNGWIYTYTLRSRKLHRVAQGTNHSTDFYGRYVAFSRGNNILRAETKGAPRVRAVQQARGGDATGRDPVMTGGGGWVWYGQGVNLLVNIRVRDQGRCPAGNVEQPDTSPHGNYAVYICTGGPAYLLYEGPK